MSMYVSIYEEYFKIILNELIMLIGIIYFLYNCIKIQKMLIFIKMSIFEKLIIKSIEKQMWDNYKKLFKDKIIFNF